MKLAFTKNAWEDYADWQKKNKKTVSKINALLKEVLRNPYEGKGKPEALKYDLKGLWSRRIDLEHRLVYKVEKDFITIYSCKFHYEK